MKRPGLFFFFLLFLVASSALSAEEPYAALIEKGERLITGGSYPAGIALLETVLAKDPKNVKVLNSLLTACDTYSQTLLAQNRFDQAQTYLRKMEELLQKIESLPASEFSNGDLKVQSRIKREAVVAKAFLLHSKQEEKVDLVSLNTGRERYNDAVAHFNKRQFDVAEQLLQESIALDPSNPYAYELLGEIANLKHRLADAEGYYRKAFSLNPDPALREKYEKLIREKNIDKTQQQYEDEHFIIRYRRDEGFEGSKIRDYLRSAYRAISQEFGYYPKYKIPVLLYGRQEYQTLTGSVPHWSGALFDGKIRLPVYEVAVPPFHGESGAPARSQAEEMELKRLIYHELTHAFVLDLSQMKCPVWLNEGLAQYEENKIQPIPLTLLANAVRANRLISLDELMFEDVSQNVSQEKAIMFYLESFSLVSYLIEHHRWYQIKQFLMELGKTAPFFEAFEKVFGRTFKDVAGEWHENLVRRYRV